MSVDIERLNPRILGIITGVLGLILLLLPVYWNLVFIFVELPKLVPGEPNYNMIVYELYPIFVLICLGINLFGLVFVVITKKLLKSSRVFGAVFISLGVLNLYFLNILGLFPFLTVLIGASLITSIAGLFQRLGSVPRRLQKAVART